MIIGGKLSFILSGATIPERENTQYSILNDQFSKIRPQTQPATAGIEN
jgi:hypothetical protein